MSHMFRLIIHGDVLREARLAQGRSVTDLAHTLLLSRRQLAQLEAGAPRDFYSDQHVSQAVRRYCAVTGASLEAALARPPEPEPETTVVRPSRRLLPATWTPMMAGPLGAFACLALVQALHFGQKSQASQLAKHRLPPVSARPATALPAAAPVTPAAAGLRGHPMSATMSARYAAATTALQLEDQDGIVPAAGERGALELPGLRFSSSQD